MDDRLLRLVPGEPSSGRISVSVVVGASDELAGVGGFLHNLRDGFRIKKSGILV